MVYQREKYCTLAKRVLNTQRMKKKKKKKVTATGWPNTAQMIIKHTHMNILCYMSKVQAKQQRAININ